MKLREREREIDHCCVEEQSALQRLNRFGGYNNSGAARVLVLPVSDYEIALLLLGLK